MTIEVDKLHCYLPLAILKTSVYVMWICDRGHSFWRLDVQFWADYNVQNIYIRLGFENMFCVERVGMT